MVSKEDQTLRAWSRLLGAHALVLRAIERRLRSRELPPLTWYDVLLELERAGGRLRVGDLAERVVIERYNMTRLLDRLEAQGLLVREKSERDRRAISVVLTQRGAQLRRRIWPHYRRAILEFFAAPLSEREAEALTRSLTKVIIHSRRESGLRDPSPTLTPCRSRRRSAS